MEWPKFFGEMLGSAIQESDDVRSVGDVGPRFVSPAVDGGLCRLGQSDEGRADAVDPTLIALIHGGPVDVPER